MNVRMPKEEMTLLIPASLSSSSSWGGAYADSYVKPEPARPTLAERVGLAVKWMMELPRRRAMLSELGTLSDHELADIGLTRSELSHVFDQAFVARRDVERTQLGAI